MIHERSFLNSIFSHEHSSVHNVGPIQFHYTLMRTLRGRLLSSRTRHSHVLNDFFVYQEIHEVVMLIKDCFFSLSLGRKTREKTRYFESKMLALHARPRKQSLHSTFFRRVHCIFFCIFLGQGISSVVYATTAVSVAETFAEEIND